jgi:hypothetical protein
MKVELEQKSTSNGFMLKFTQEEKKKLQMAAMQNNTTITSVIKYLINTKKTIEDLLKEN